MHRSAVAVAASLLLSASPAWPWRARLVARGPRDPVFSVGSVQARVGERVRLAVLLEGPGGARYGPAAGVRLGAAVRPARPLPAGTRVRWLRVIPRMEHVETPSPNPGVASFSNAVLFGPRHGRWIGYDRLEYETRDLAPAGGVIDGDELSIESVAMSDETGGAGSAWFSAAVTLPDGTTVRAPDGASTDRLGLSRDVARVSLRADDSYLGWLSTYFGVASVFGSNGTSADHQTDRYTGADCADVLVGALRAAGARGQRYLSVAEIGEAAARTAGPFTIDAAGAVRARDGARVALRWAQDVRPGDLVTLNYLDDPGAALPRAWDHIGALVSDRNGDGVLDGGDALRHMGGRGLTDTPLLHGGPVQIALWRWRRPGPVAHADEWTATPAACEATTDARSTLAHHGRRRPRRGEALLHRGAEEAPVLRSALLCGL